MLSCTTSSAFTDHTNYKLLASLGLVCAYDAVKELALVFLLLISQLLLLY
jgi:hypothetical protein